MCWLQWFVCIFLCVAAPTHGIVGGGPAAPPEPDAAVVFVQRHGRSARIEGMKNDQLGYYSFVGIRYAEPPVGIRRFQRPVRRYLAGELSSKNQCLPCPQADPSDSRRMIGHEDCLCLNIYAPKMPGEEEGCPVIFFIHGGNYRSGSITPYGGQHFAQKDTILVTAQYRLGSLGFLSTGQRDASGNVGIFDLYEAMNWIKDYIEFFGGDTKRIVVMGQGSGGSAASLIGLSPEGRSATGVAALSGAPLSPGAIRSDPQRHANELANQTNCPQQPAERLLMCLRKLPVEKVVQADKTIYMNVVDTKAFLDEISGRSGTGARVEGPEDNRGLPTIITDVPANSMKTNKQLSPLLIGVTSAETSHAVYGKYAGFLSNQLNQVKDFIKTEIIGGLRGVIQGVPNLLSTVKVAGQPLPLADFYQSVFDSSLNVVDGLTQIVEATGDALFNFPAFKTLESWRTDGEAFLYSFEHVGNLSKGSHFLPGLALTDNTQEDPSLKKIIRGPAHGDELAYLFEPLDSEGNPIIGEISQVDANVRDSFVKLFSKFAHNLGTVKKQNKTNLLGLIPFSKDNDQFIKITDKIETGQKFRFCQMGLWGEMGDRLNDILCKNILSNLLNLPKLSLPPLLPAQGNAAQQNPLGNTLGNLLGGKQNKPTNGGVLNLFNRP